MDVSSAPVVPCKSRGDIYEGIAFTFCKAATASLFITLLLSQRFVVPALLLLTVTYYALTWYNGRKVSRCLMRFPWLIISVYGTLGLLSLALVLQGKELPSLLGRL